MGSVKGVGKGLKEEGGWGVGGCFWGQERMGTVSRGISGAQIERCVCERERGCERERVREGEGNNNL